MRYRLVIDLPIDLLVIRHILADLRYYRQDLEL